MTQQASTPSDGANRVVLNCKNLLCQDSLLFAPPLASLSGTWVDQVPQLLLTQVLHTHTHRVSGSLALTPLHNILIDLLPFTDGTFASDTVTHVPLVAAHEGVPGLPVSQAQEQRNLVNTTAPASSLLLSFHSTNP